jgi:hypothetical protein
MKSLNGNIFVEPFSQIGGNHEVNEVFNEEDNHLMKNIDP